MFGVVFRLGIGVVSNFDYYYDLLYNDGLYWVGIFYYINIKSRRVILYRMIWEDFIRNDCDFLD